MNLNISCSVKRKKWSAQLWDLCSNLSAAGDVPWFGCVQRLFHCKREKKISTIITTISPIIIIMIISVSVLFIILVPHIAWLFYSIFIYIYTILCEFISVIFLNDCLALMKQKRIQTVKNPGWIHLKELFKLTDEN